MKIIIISFFYYTFKEFVARTCCNTMIYIFFFLRSRYNPFHISLPLFIVQYTENRQEIMNYEICKIKLDHIWKYIFQYSHNLFSAILWVSLLPLWHFKYFRYNMRRSIFKLYGKKNSHEETYIRKSARQEF